jgi:glycosyltransferase involved in cell wall biosynthesis
MQKTNFPMEVLINDDASTDGTADIIREYEQRYPEIIKPVYQTENQWSKGVSISRTFNFPRVQGKYMALCEGDDYWTDEYKLQKQVDFLEANEDVSICFHPVKVYDEEQGIFIPNTTVPDVPEITDINYLASGQYINTLSVMYRVNQQVFIDLNMFPPLIIEDYPLHMLFAKYGKIRKLQDTMAVYRMHKGGILSLKPFDEIRPDCLKSLGALICHFINNEKISLILMNRYTLISNTPFSDSLFHSYTLYLDKGKGYSEDEKSTLFFSGNKIDLVCDIPKDTITIKFVPPREGRGCILKDLNILSDNGKVKYTLLSGFKNIEGNIIFQMGNTQIELQGVVNQLKIKCNILFLSDTMPNDLINEYVLISQKFDTLINSRSWRITKPLRTFAGFVRQNSILHLFAKGLLSIKRNGITETVKKIITYKQKQISLLKSNTLIYESEYQDNIDFSNYEPKVKAIAFYLPQFHTIPENDKWWGKGFTEWTKTRKAKPRFKGHYQPREPHNDIGYYDLSNVETLKKQAELAKQHGIYGFCFYLYWFSGKRLLEKPLDLLLEHPEIDINFCLCWANENWTRRWDGQDQEVLIKQNYLKDDPYMFIEDMKKYFVDKRYIRINGNPVVLVYKPHLIPSAKETFKIWKKHALEVGIGKIKIWITNINSYTVENPDIMAVVDGEVEFPPTMDIFQKDAFHYKNGFIYDYKEQVALSKQRIDIKNERNLPLLRTCMLAWDNAARKKYEWSTFVKFSLRDFFNWASLLVSDALQSQDKIFFINAWNEWAEGTYLEPDRKHGYANINTLSKAIYGQEFNNSSKSIIFVGHDAQQNGAQLLALNIIRQLTVTFKYNVYLILIKNGTLIDEFKAVSAETFIVEDNTIEYLKLWIKSLNTTKAICNTAITGDILHLLTECGVSCISLIHEMENMIHQYSCESKLKSIVADSLKIVFPSEYAKKSNEQIISIPNDKVVIQPQGLYAINPYLREREKVHSLIRRTHKIPQDGKIILGMGYGDHRKGFDLFLQCMVKVCKEFTDAYFIWVGNIDNNILLFCKDIVNKYKQNKKLILPGFRKEYLKYYIAADLLLLTSREDPFPSVVMDAIHSDLPVIAFNNGGGFVEIINERTGILVPMENTDIMSDHIKMLLDSDDLNIKSSDYGYNYIKENFNFIKYVYFLLSLLGIQYKKVSVIIPNYNYAKFLKERINSVLSQTYPVFEILILDDCSTDNSLSIIDKYKKEYPLRIEVIRNIENSGNVFKQWEKGIKAAKGDYIWIAEADDLSEPTFLETLINGMTSDESIVMGYTQSKIINEYGKITGNDYLFYTDTIDTKWRSNYITSGKDEIEKRLSIKNTIPNVSAVVFKNEKLLDALKNSGNYGVAGDWRFYIDLLKESGNVLFIANNLNIHRRHSSSVTKTLYAQKHYNEVCEIQDYIFKITNNSSYLEKAKEYREVVKKHLGIS